MIEIGTLTLFREKSIVHKFRELGDDEEQDDEPVLTIRSNRVTIPVKTKGGTNIVIVRGQNIPGTLRMTAVAVDEMRRDPNLLQDPGAADWDSLMRR